MRIIIGISGASGAIYGITALEMAKACGHEVHLIMTRAAERTIVHETRFTVEEVCAKADRWYHIDDIGASPASGSAPFDAMIVAPCSIRTLSGIAVSYTNDLLIRAADVTLKEGRPLLLAVRETPFHAGHIDLMARAAYAGAVIFPPIPTFYDRPESIDEMVRATIGRMLKRVGVQGAEYPKWEGDGSG